MGNDFDKKYKKEKSKPYPKPPTMMEVKTYIMVIQNKLTLFRNKKVVSIKRKRQEIAQCLRENNLDVAKAKMDSIIREEDTITCYDILGPICEILKERVTYLLSQKEVQPDIRAQLDSLIYAATRLEMEELMKLRQLIRIKFGELYVSKADSNADGLVNINMVEKLKVKPAADAFIVVRLKQLVKEDKINYEFPIEMGNEDMGGNPFDNNNNNNNDNNNNNNNDNNDNNNNIENKEYVEIIK